MFEEPPFPLSLFTVEYGSSRCGTLARSRRFAHRIRFVRVTFSLRCRNMSSLSIFWVIFPVYIARWEFAIDLLLAMLLVEVETTILIGSKQRHRCYDGMSLNLDNIDKLLHSHVSDDSLRAGRREGDSEKLSCWVNISTDDDADGWHGGERCGKSNLIPGTDTGGTYRARRSQSLAVGQKDV